MNVTTVDSRLRMGVDVSVNPLKMITEVIHYSITWWSHSFTLEAGVSPSWIPLIHASVDVRGLRLCVQVSDLYFGADMFLDTNRLHRKGCQPLRN